MSGFLARLARRTLRAMPDVMSAATPYATVPQDAAAVSELPAAMPGPEGMLPRLSDQRGESRAPAAAEPQVRPAETMAPRAAPERGVDDEPARRAAATPSDGIATPPAPQSAAPARTTRAPAAPPDRVPDVMQSASPATAIEPLLERVPVRARAAAATAAPVRHAPSSAASPRAAARMPVPAMRGRPAPPGEPARSSGPTGAPRDGRRQGERIDDDAPTTVHVTIGRIEIAAVQPTASAPAARAARAGDRPLSLDDYLARRGRR